MSEPVSNAAVLNLASLLNHAPGSEGEVEGDGLLLPDAADLEAAGIALEGPLEWELVVTNAGGDDDFIVQGSVAGAALMECRRCLEIVATESEADLVYPAEYRPGTGAELRLEERDDEDDLLVFGRPQVDFADLLLQVFAIDLPLTVLCREECRGLSSDGVNLNDHPDHVAPDEARSDEGAADSPFAALRDIDLRD